MFSRRRGSSAARRPVDSSTSSNAALAASQAFLKKSPSNASLSSAAAAAALRSVTSSPEPVGNIVTKRMIRRGSVSSVGSGSVMGGGARGGPVRPGLQRQNSSGSMTERSFRSPSPGRHNGAVPASRDAPPVPTIPARLPSGHQRSSSVDPPPRVLSPTPRRNGRNMSVDRANVPPPISTGSGKRLSDVNEELQRTDSNTSVNFSRPRSSQPSSPVGSPVTAMHFTHGTGAWHMEPTGASAQSIPATSNQNGKLARIQAAAYQTMDKSAPSARPSLATNASYEGPPAMSYESDHSVMVYDPNTRSFVSKPRPKPKQPETRVVLPAAPLPIPGTYDPNTRTFTPASPVTTPNTEKAPSQFQVIDPRLQPPPRNPARISPTETPIPLPVSVVRKGPTAEDKVETLKPTKAYSIPAVTNAESSKGAEPKSLVASPEISSRGRNLSTSPSPHRAHFPHSPVVEAQRHNPPDRDLSPAKSALKHSPANSLRASSPLIFASSAKPPPSEVSDYSDVGSQDGLGVKKKKKTVRVSFEEQPVEIEPTPIVARARTPLQDDDDNEEIMAPRPALPSFGSVRRDRVGAEVAEKVTEMTPTRQAASSDHAIGGILKNAHDPAVLEITSKESLGNVSDESEEHIVPAQTLDVAENDHIPEQAGPKVENADLSLGAPKIEELDLPAINLLPPTPGVEEDKPLGDSIVSETVPSNVHAHDEFSDEDANEADAAAIGIASTSATAGDPHDGFTSFVTPGMLEAINEDSDDDAANFSDAAEDLSELDNGGFVSMDAVAVSPVNTAKAPPTRVSPPESPLAKQTARNSERVEVEDETDKRATGDWSEATAYWKRLSRQQREQIEREHFSSDDEVQPVAVRRPKKVTKQTATNPANTPTAVTQEPQRPVTQQVSKQVPTTTPSQPVKTAMKKSLRDKPVAAPAPAPAPADGEVHMRRSMRNGGTTMTASLRNEQAQRPQSAIIKSQAPAQGKATRPVSTGPIAASNQAIASQGRASQDSAYPRIESTKASQPAPVVSRRLQKELKQNDDSDSESSFKKKRRSQAKDTGGRYSMRRSMRAGSVDRGSIIEERPTSPTPAKGKRSLSIRSLSPTGSFLGRNRGEKLRESLRGNDSGTRLTLRGPQSLRNAEKPRSSNSNRLSAAKPSSRFRSRFGDSDDEDDVAPSRGVFRSRFADSDDEDAGADLTPVRGIPRPVGRDDGDSTDLEDEDEDFGAKKTSRKREKMSKPMVPDPADIDRAMDAARKKLGLTNEKANGNTGVVTNGNTNGTTAPPKTPVDNKEGSVLMRGSLRNRSDSDRLITKPPPPPPESVQGSVNGDTPTKRRGFMGSILRRNRASSSSIPTINHGRTSAIPPSSIPGNNTVTTPDKGEEPTTAPSPQRNSMPPRLTRGDSNYSNVTAPPVFGDRGEHWPLPPPVPQIPDSVLRHDSRVNGSIRPASSDGPPNKGRQASSVRFEEGVLDNNIIYSHRTGKKKRFGVIRRAFGLND